MTQLKDTLPDFTKELDEFEDDLTEFVQSASPAALVALVHRATTRIEKMAEAGDPDTFRFEGWTELNNATSACNTAAMALKNRI